MDPAEGRPKRRIALIYDGKALKRWQLEAIERLRGDYEIYHLVVEDRNPPKRRFAKHGAYYALNLASLRNRMTRTVPYARGTPADRSVHEFTPAYEGAWAILPRNVHHWLAENRIEAVVKFALSLLRIEPGLPPILSYHHGDPERFRGRPAGFYELAEGAPFVGQIVQRLSNELDAGSILAFAQSRVHRHSYRKTMTEAYALSPALLPLALANLFAGEEIERGVGGRNYRLPDNRKVLRACGTMARAALARLFYGAFREKRWNVSRAIVPHLETGLRDFARRLEAASGSWLTYDIAAGYTFYADPFFESDDAVLVEGLNKRTGKGEIVRLSSTGATPLAMPRSSHYSYPAVYPADDGSLCIPERAATGESDVYRLSGDEVELSARLEIASAGLLDPTLFSHEDTVFLFANDKAEGATILRLWLAGDIHGEFVEHPASPIRVSARGARMGGLIFSAEGRHYRFGQDFERSYGDALLVYEIEEIDRSTYREREIGRIAFETLRGPHTLNFRGNSVVFDWYTERFSLLAGVRRLAAKL